MMSTLKLFIKGPRPNNIEVQLNSKKIKIKIVSLSSLFSLKSLPLSRSPFSLSPFPNLLNETEAFPSLLFLFF